MVASFVFAKFEGNVGEPSYSQLVVESAAHTNSAPIALTEVKIVFEGSLRPIKLLANTENNTSDNKPCEIATVSLRDSVSSNSSAVQSPTGGLVSMVGTTNLTFNPSQKRAFNLVSIPREAGEARVASIALTVEEEAFSITYVVTEQTKKQTVWWEEGNRGPVCRRIGKDWNTSVCRILPKPPKVRITMPHLQPHYYTDEQVVLDIQIDNEETESVELTLEVKFFGHSETSAKVFWLDEEGGIGDSDHSVPSSPAEAGPFTQIIRRPVGKLESGKNTVRSISLSNTSDPVDYDFEILASYHLVSDVETPIHKSLPLDVSFIRPFEANYEFLPRLHPAPWPDFFHVDDSDSDNDDEEAGKSTVAKPDGLRQRWCLNSKVVSFAPEPLVIEGVDATLLGVTGGSVNHIGRETLKSLAVPQIGPEELRESEFLMEIQRLSLDDRRATSLNLALDIRWRRPDSKDNEQHNTSTTINSKPGSTTLTNSTTCTLAVPRFLVPMGEPRVLASATPSPKVPGFVHLDYTLENPSMHFLTFNISLEASDQFAFSGPKSTAVQLVPLSRHTIRYNLLATVRGTWIQPQLVVVDSYFNQTLRVLATEGMRTEKKGVSVWIDADG